MERGRGDKKFKEKARQGSESPDDRWEGREEKRGDRKGERKGGRGQGKDSQIVKVSKAMSYVLRHGAVKQGLQIRPDGYVRTEDLIQFLRKGRKDGPDLDMVRTVVEKNDKKRFEFEGKDFKFIRATQGHSLKDAIDTEQLLQEIKSPEEYPQVVHGTYSGPWKIIREEGLSRMARNHIHFSVGLPGDKEVISGMRGTCDVYIELDMGLAMKDGIKFYVSSNKVVLSEGKQGRIAPLYFKRVTTKEGKVVFEGGAGV